MQDDLKDLFNHISFETDEGVVTAKNVTISEDEDEDDLNLDNEEDDYRLGDIEIQETRASTRQLESLHGTLANYFKRRLASNDELSGGELSAIITFLKNNDIKSSILDLSDKGGLVPSSLKDRISIILKSN